MNTGKSRAARATNDQKLLMVYILTQNREMTYDNCVSSLDEVELNNQKWNSLAIELNKLNGANKTGEKWRKYWHDQRLYVNERYALINSTRETGNIFTNIKELSDYEKQVIALSCETPIQDPEVIVIPSEFEAPSPKKRKPLNSENSKEYKKYLEFEQKKFLFVKRYKSQKLKSMEKLGKKQIQIELSKIKAINQLRETIQKLIK